LVLHYNILTVEVIKFLDFIPRETDVLLTGRYTPKKLTDRADFVNEIKDLKHPKESNTTKGIRH